MSKPRIRSLEFFRDLGCALVSPLTCNLYMKVSCQGRRGGRSTPQSKKGLTTTDLGINAALSSRLGPPSGESIECEKAASPQSTDPSIAFA